jgi:hypothetical protein
MMIHTSIPTRNDLLDCSLKVERLFMQSYILKETVLFSRNLIEYIFAIGVKRFQNTTVEYILIINKAVMRALSYLFYVLDY